MRSLDSPSTGSHRSDAGNNRKILVEQRNIRIVAVGDDLLAGIGDPRALGWFGRVMARTPQNVAPVVSYNLAAPGEGSETLNERWFEEASRRFASGADNRLVVAPSTFDIDTGLTSARSRLNLANMVDLASQNNIKVLVVGPPADPRFRAQPTHRRSFRGLRGCDHAPSSCLRRHVQPPAAPRAMAPGPGGE
jgi:hypothetical protein